MAKARAVRIREPGEIDVLEIGELDVRNPGPGEIAVDVAAAGVNRADLLQRRGVYPPPPGYPQDVRCLTAPLSRCRAPSPLTRGRLRSERRTRQRPSKEI